jgi:class 3 adenylate cyclase
VPSRHDTRYAKTGDGSQIAYQVVGDGPIDLVLLPGAPSHVDVRWEHPASAGFLERLATFSRLLLFDRRGLGASDHLPPDTAPTWEEWADDLHVVLDAVGSERSVPFAIGQGGAMAATFAATHPERVEALVLFHATGSADEFGEISEEIANLVADAEEELWGTLDWVRVLAPSLVDDPDQSAWLAKYMRATATPRAMAAHTRATWKANSVDFLLLAIRVPTLVMHRTGFTLQPVDVARSLSKRIPDARFAEIPGTDAMPQTQHRDLILDAVQEFVTGIAPVAPTSRFLTTVLFTDIVDSTRLANTIGDRKWHEYLDAHDSMVRGELARHRGNEVKTTGDGFLVTFDGPGRAIQCGQRIREGARALGLEVRVGLHTGDFEARGDDIGGIAVHIGARVAALAGPGEILVSRTVTDLVAGSGITFEDRGEHHLKGVPVPWRIFAVSD